MTRVGFFEWALAKGLISALVSIQQLQDISTAFLTAINRQSTLFVEAETHILPKNKKKTKIKITEIIAQ